MRPARLTPSTFGFDTPNRSDAFRDQIVHVIALLDTPTYAWTVVMEEAGRVLMARTNYE